jgi:hypothetical protein
MEDFDMKTLLHSLIVLIAAMGLLVAGTVMADSPVSLTKPDSHSVEVKGKVNLYRVQVEDMDFGAGPDKIHAQIFVTLDSQPGKVYGLSLDEPGSETHDPVTQLMATTLRTAYVKKLPVTLYYQIDMKRKNNFRIMMVQLN